MKKKAWNSGMKFEFKRRKEQVVKNCAICNKEFSTPPSLARIKYCSRECYWSGMKGRKLTIAQKDKQSTAMKIRSKDPIYMKKVSSGLRKKWADPEYREKMKGVHERNWQNETTIENHHRAVRSKEHREFKSKQTANILLNTSFNYVGYFFSQKNNKWMGYRSEDECIFMKMLEMMCDLARYEGEHEKVRYTREDGSRHWTVPDFHLYWKDEMEEIVEYKPTFKIVKNMHNTLAKFIGLDKYTRERGMEFNVITDANINLGLKIMPRANKIFPGLLTNSYWVK